MSFAQLLLDGQSSQDSDQQTYNEQSLRFFSTERGEEVEMRWMNELMQRLANELMVNPAFKDLVHQVARNRADLATERLWTSLHRKHGNEILTSQERNLKLKFVNKIPLVVYTREKIVGEDSAPIGIALVDGITDEVVNSGDLASAEVEIVVLEGDFGGNNRGGWTAEEFDSQIVKEMPGRKSILTGNKVNLTEGTALLTELAFIHNSNWVKIRKFRLGAKVRFNGIRVKEAKTEPFTLKDFRATYQQKPDMLSLNDEVSKLKRIGKNGPFHKRLIEANVNTVQDFLVQLSINPERLQQMHNGSNKVWTVIVHHARECVIDKTVHVYPSPNSGQNTLVVFNVVGQVLGLFLQNQYVPIIEVSQTQKADAHKLVVSAFEHQDHVLSFADENELTKDLSHLYKASNGNHSLNDNIVDDNVANCISQVSSIDIDEVWSAVAKKIRMKWKLVYVALKFVNNKRTLAIRVEGTHIQKKRKF